MICESVQLLRQWASSKKPLPTHLRLGGHVQLKEVSSTNRHTSSWLPQKVGEIGALWMAAVSPWPELINKEPIQIELKFWELLK